MLQVIRVWLFAYMPRVQSQRGQDLIEYALLAGMIALAITGVIGAGIMTGAVDGMAKGIAGCIGFQKAKCTTPW